MIEILVVIAIITILFAVGLLMSMSAYHGYSRRSEREVIVSLMERARSRAMANVHQHEWGTCVDPSIPAYFVFSGPDYASAFSTEEVPANPGVVVDISAAPDFDCTSGGIIFSQLTGNSSGATITLYEGPVVSTIAVNAVGRVDW